MGDDDRAGRGARVPSQVVPGTEHPPGWGWLAGSPDRSPVLLSDSPEPGSPGIRAPAAAGPAWSCPAAVPADPQRPCTAPGRAQRSGRASEHGAGGRGTRLSLCSLRVRDEAAMFAGTQLLGSADTKPPLVGKEAEQSTAPTC
jgi:hypothetical protein